MSDTIAAVATGQVLSAIGILRVSGDDTLSVIDRVFTPVKGAPMSCRPDRTLVSGTLTDENGAVLDLCLCTISHGPGSYTGEDTAELQCHGSPVVLREGLAALFAAGARQALPGEFTRRAFLNGRMDLSQAEAVIDLIHAETAAGARNAASQLGGAIRRKTDAIYDSLASISAHYHAVIDYPDEDIEEFSLRSYLSVIDQAVTDLSDLSRSFRRGRILLEGIPTAIVGRPNAGKSTLLNMLLGYERAIVTDVPGTTRDTITEKVHLGSVCLRLTDTAGLRETGDRIERLGVERSRQALHEAELVLLLIDAHDEAGIDEKLIDELDEAGKPYLVLLNKTDLLPDDTPPSVPACCRKASAIIPFSALTGEGLRELEEVISGLYPPWSAPAGEIITNARQADAVDRALDYLALARQAMADGQTPDVVLTETEGAMQAIGEINGRTVREDITAQIFARFCVGK